MRPKINLGLPSTMSSAPMDSKRTCNTIALVVIQTGLKLRLEGEEGGGRGEEGLPVR